MNVILRAWAIFVVATKRLLSQRWLALATVVGVLIEVPVMLLVVRIVNRTRGWYDAGAKPA